MSGHSSGEGAEKTVASSITVGAAKRRGVRTQTAEKKTGMFVSCVCVCVCVCTLAHAYMRV